MRGGEMNPRGSSPVQRPSRILGGADPSRSRSCLRSRTRNESAGARAESLKALTILASPVCCPRETHRDTQTAHWESPASRVFFEAPAKIKWPGNSPRPRPPRSNQCRKMRMPSALSAVTHAHGLHDSVLPTFQWAKASVMSEIRFLPSISGPAWSRESLRRIRPRRSFLMAQDRPPHVLRTTGRAQPILRPVT